jgi:hypothetical protein
VVRRGLTAVTNPAICWLVFLFVYIGWHDPSLYDLALRVEWVHNLEHITFFWRRCSFGGRWSTARRICTSAALLGAHHLPACLCAAQRHRRRFDCQRNEVIYTYY